MPEIRIAIAGVGNCASALLQGIEFYKRELKNDNKEYLGVMHREIGGYQPEDIKIVAAFDIDERKVGRPLEEAIFAAPNCCVRIVDKVESNGVVVNMAPVMDGFSDHINSYPADQTFLVSNQKPVDVEKVLSKSGAEILINYLPVGSEKAARYYAESCLKTGVSFINCMPAFIVSDPEWSNRFETAGISIVGDDIKS